MSEWTDGKWMAQGVKVLSQEAESMICEVSELYTKYAVHEPVSMDSAYWYEAMANTRLIAAAPQLYEELANALILVRLKYGNLDHEVWDWQQKVEALLKSAKVE